MERLDCKSDIQMMKLDGLTMADFMSNRDNNDQGAKHTPRKSGQFSFFSSVNYNSAQYASARRLEN